MLCKASLKGKEFKHFAQVFQALRIEVNTEMKAFEDFCTNVASNGNRRPTVVMSYHSHWKTDGENFYQQGVKRFGEGKEIFWNEIKLLSSESKTDWSFGGK